MISRNSKVHNNVFTGGYSGDLNENFQASEQYKNAHNISLVESGKFLSAQNIQGTTNIQTILGDSDSICIGAFSTRYKIGNTYDVNCITIFTVTPASLLKIWCYDIDNDDIYELFEENIDSSYLTDETIVDSVLYPEGGIDILYFTDFNKELRKLRCEIPSSYTPNFLTAFDLSLQRRAAAGQVQLLYLLEGGSLLNGSYQIAYQLCNPNKNIYSKVSLFCNPIMVYNDENDLITGNIVGGGVGTISRFKIVVNILLGADEIDQYTHFRLIVKENIYPEGTDVTTLNVTPLMEISEYQDEFEPNRLILIEYKSNVQTEAPLELSDVVVDQAAIDRVKTLEVTDDRLLAGNVVYKNLNYDNGTPEVVSGSIIKRTSLAHLDLFSDSVNSSVNRGYFRDEVYRFAISYFDGFGNFSEPSVLDMSGVVHNRIGLGSGLFGIEQFNDASFNSGFDAWSSVGSADWILSGVGEIRSGRVVLSTTTTSFESSTLYQSVTPNSTSTYGYEFIVDSTDLNPTTGDIEIDLEIVFLQGSTILDSFVAATITSSSIFTDIIFSGSFSGSIIPVAADGIGFRAIHRYIAAWGNSAVELTSVSLIKQDIESGEGNSNLIDMKFPKRSDYLDSTTYTIFNSNINDIQSLGLELEIDNHPTWAKGFVILRVPRIKNILFQTPIIPMVSYYGVGPVENYPTISDEPGSTSGNATDLVGTQPMGPNTTYFPNNYFMGYRPVNIIKNETKASATINSKTVGEAYMSPASYSISYYSIFPQDDLYSTTKQFNFQGGLYLDTVDACAMRGITSLYSSDTIDNHGEYIDTSIAMTLFSVEDENYYYNSSHTGNKQPLRNSGTKIKDYKFFGNNSEGGVVGGSDVLKYNNLITEGLTWGIPGNTQAQGVIRTDTSIPLINYNQNLTFASSPTFVDEFETGDPSTFKVTPTDEDAGLQDDYITTIEVCNVVRNLSDDRYGDINYPHKFISTGTIYTFDSNELETVEAGTTLPITVQVMGGDCSVSSHVFKLTDTVYTVTNQGKFESSPDGDNESEVIDRFGRTFLNIGTSVFALSIPVPLKNAAQYVQIVLESEYVGEVLDNTSLQSIYSVGTGASPHTVCGVNDSAASEFINRIPLSYNYNINYSKLNDDKIFSKTDPNLPKIYDLGARIVYSDKKVYQTNIEGFNSFKVLNTFDLEEKYGDIFKLSVVGDDLYAIQESAITYLGASERRLETTDGLTLSIHSGDLIGNTVLVDNRRGTQHLGGVLNTGKSLYILDNNNKAVYRITGRGQLEILSDKGVASEFRLLLSNDIPERNIITVYDPLKRDIWFIKNNSTPFCYVYNEALDFWTSQLDFSAGNIYAGQFNDKIYLIGRGSDTSTLNIHEMYTGPYTYLMGQYVTPRLTFTVNPDTGISKVFDAILVNSTSNLYDLDIFVQNDTVTGIDLDVSNRGEGNYRTKLLRTTSGNNRPRGLYADGTIRWESSVDQQAVALSQILTKYRISENSF